MANRFLSNITINDQYTFPSTDGSAGQAIITDGSGNLTFGSVASGETDKALSLTLRVKNTESIALTKGQVVCAAPSATPPSGNVIEVKLADNNGTDSMPAIGILNEGLDAAGGANDEGEAIMFGRISGIDTSAFSVGDEVFVSDTAGALTATKPTGVKYIQKVGVIMRDDATNGTIEVFGAGRTNDVPTPLYIDHANQRVGVGVTDPDYLLSTSGTGNNRISVNSTDSGTSGIYFRVLSGGSLIGNGTIATQSNGDMKFFTGTSSEAERMRIDSSGRVSINGLSNGADLTILEQGSTSALLQSTGGLFMQSGSATSLVFQTNGANERMRIDSSGQAWFKSSTDYKIGLNDSAGVNQWWLKAYQSGAFAIHENGVEDKLTILAGGNVGIGNTTPSYKLDVSGIIRAKEFITVKGTSNSVIADYNLPDSTSVNLGTYINEYAFIDLSSSHNDGGWIDFSKADGTDYAGRIRYNNSSEQFDIYTTGRETLSIESGGDASSSWGQAKIYLSNHWAGDTNYYPFIGSEGGSAGSLIMFDNPHVAWSEDNAFTGFTGRSGLRLARNTSGNFWDVGLAGDFYHIARSGTGELFRVTNNGSVNFAPNGSRPMTYDSNDGNIRITPNSGGWSTGYFFNGSAGTFKGGFGLLGSADTATYFWIGDNYNDTTMVIEPNAGNVGIGTASPSQKLQVEGNSWIKGIYYDTSGDAGASGQVLSSTATGTNWITLNDIYYTETESDSRFVNVAGDTMTGSLSLGDNNLTDIGKINFENHEGTDYGVTGDVMFDENFYSDPEYGTAWSSSNGGGLAVYNEDGWGRILTDRNIQWHTATFDGLKVGSNTVFHDGYHPNADTLTTARTISLTGDVTGSVSFNGSSNVSITTVVANDSHTHDGRYYTETESDARYVQQGGTSFTGEYPVVVRVTDRNFYSDGNIKFRGSDSRLTVDGSVASPIFYDSASTGFHWDPNTDNSHRFTTASGYLDIGPKNTSWAHIYTDRPGFYFNKTTFQLNGNQVFHDGYHPNADALTTSRTISLTGDVTGSVSFNGSSNVSITTTVANDSHTHDGRYYTETESDNRFLRSDTSDSMAGTLTLNSGGTNTYGRIRGYENDNHFIVIRGSVATGTSNLTITGSHQTTFVEHADDANEGWYFVSKASGNYTEMARIDGVGQMYIGGNKVWHAGNDGSGSGLDADTLDGINSGSFIRSDANDTATGAYTFSGQVTFTNNVVIQETAPTISFLDTNSEDDFYIHINSNNFYVLRNTNNSENTVDGGWDTPHPLQLEGDTNVGYLFGNRIFADNYHPNADTWTTARTITIGNTGKSVNGSANVSWSLSEIGATPLDDIRSLGVQGFTGTATTAGLISEMEGDGAFDSYSSVFKTSWSYAGNFDLSDAGRFTETAGTSWITWTDNSSDSTRGNITALAIAPNTGGSAGRVFIYNDQGSGYSPGWREVWTSRSDGSGSGLDADLLDGQHASYFLDTSGTAQTKSGNLTINGNLYLGDQMRVGDDAWIEDFNVANAIKIKGNQNNANGYIAFGSQNDLLGRAGTGALTWAGNTVWHAGNDGSGSGLDADLLDGISSGSFIRSDANDTFTGTIVGNVLHLGGSEITGSSAKLQVNGFQRTGTIYLHEGTSAGATNYPLETVGSELRWNTNKVWHAGNDGSGSGLDADTVDSLQASQFLRSDASDTMTGDLTINGTLILGANTINDVEDIYLRDRIYHDGDTNTYIQFHAADQFRVVTGGTERFEVNNSQAYASHSFRAPIFYDSNDTNYYLDPNSTTTSAALAGRITIGQLNTANSADNWSIKLIENSGNCYISNHNATAQIQSGGYLPNATGTTVQLDAASSSYAGIWAAPNGKIHLVTAWSATAGGTPNYEIGFTMNDLGRVGIGDTTPSYQLQLSLNSAAKPTSSAWTVVSDERVKTNIQDYTTGLNEILQINPKTFDYNGKAGFDTTAGNIGIIAQDVISIMPETINTYNAKLNEDDTEDTELFNFDSHPVQFALINAIKELNSKIEALEARIQTLENQ